MRNVLLKCLTVGLVLFSLATGEVPTSADSTAPSPLTVPIVFVARNHLDTIDGKYVGPPVEVLGREKAVGGKLMVLYPDQRLVDLTSGKLFDVSRPMVSFDATRVVFSGIESATSQWHIYEVALDGSGFRQLTFDDRYWTIPVDPLNPRANQSRFSRYGDFSPAYLPDGRIVFSSSRYPSLSGSCGQRALNLYVMNSDGSDTHRITTERAGAIDPYVLDSGRIVFSHWVDNMNVPAPAGFGLRPLEVERNFASSFWIFWATNPDGTGAGRYAFNGGKFKDQGGVFQPREMPDGRIVYTYRAAGNLLGSTLATSIAILTPGPGDGNSVKGLGDPVNLEGAHALSPAPLPDGCILFSLTPSSSVSTNSKGKTTAQFDYGLYMTDDKFQQLSLVYNDANTDELDAVAAYPRIARVVPDIPGATMVTDDPAVDLGGKALLQNDNIYADLPPEFREILSPLAGSVVAVDFYDDSQTFNTSSEFPEIRKQPPKFIGSVPVNPDGSFTATVPADRPIFWLLRTASGVVARSVTSPPTETFTSFVPTHDYFRPGQVATCVGCHRGHMIRPDITFSEGKTNLARLATATASSSLDSYDLAAWRVNDSRLSDNAAGRYTWASNGESAPWVQLLWQAPVTANEIVLYPRTQKGNKVDRATLYFSDGSSVAVPGPLDGSAPVKVQFPARTIFWVRFQVEAGQGPSLGLAEMLVHGSQEVSLPSLSPSAPRGLKATQGTLLLAWDRNQEPYLGGYRVYYGIAPGKYSQMLDVGNVDKYLLDRLDDGVTYYIALKSYTLEGKESPGFSNEVKATFFAPKVQGLSLNVGPAFGGTPVTIKGEHFTKGALVLFGGTHAIVTDVTPTAIQVLTQHHTAGTVDVLVINPDGSRDTLPKSFTYLKQ